MQLRHLFLVLAAISLPACHRSTPATGNAASPREVTAESPSSPSVAAAAGNGPSAAPLSPAAGQAANAPAGPPTGGAAMSAAMKDQAVGEPKGFDNLTVFPIFAKKQTDVGPMTTLEDALAKGQAEVREVGAEGRPSAQVNTLVIENKGNVPIYVLAGTVVKGGNQDRQIGQDFIIESKRTTPIDAFCVEHGRWTSSRDGRATGGRFGATQQLVTSSVRAAGQYKKDQGEVWAKVEATNEANKKSAASGTLFATLDDPEVQKKRSALAEKVNGYLASAPPSENVVGFAYAIDGQVKGARWFASHKVFELFRAQLVNGAAVDALTAQAGRGGAPPPKSAPLKVDSVVSFVDDVEKVQAAEQRDTAAANANQYKESAKAYGSKTMRKPTAAQPAAPPVQISSDYLAK